MVLGTENKEEQEMNSGLDYSREPESLALDGQRTMLDETIEAIIHWTEQAFGNEEIIRAKEDFFVRIGKVFSDDPHYMSFMTFFLDHLIFERPAGVAFQSSLRVHFPDAASLELTPFYLAIRAKPWPSMSLKPPMVKELRGFCHSIYQVLAVTKFQATFQDLLTSEKLEVHARPGESLTWIARKECFQTHLYQWGDKLHLSEGVICHPAAVRRTILKRIKLFKKGGKRSPGDFLLALAYAKLKHLRLKTTNPTKIYSEV